MHKFPNPARKHGGVFDSPHTKSPYVGKTSPHVDLYIVFIKLSRQRCQMSSKKGDKMNAKGKTSIKESKPKMTASALMRLAGVSAMAAGTIFAGIQPIHPPDVLESVTTGGWAIITALKFAMCFFFLFGITGLYARQVEEFGWLGLMGYLVFSLSWALQSGFVFVEVLLLPVLATAAPQFVVSYLGVVNGHPGEMNIGVLPVIYNLLVGIPYMLGGLLFGIATLRARIMPRWPATLLAAVALLTPAAVLLPHAIQRMAAGVPMGLAIAWLGYALWSERRKKSSTQLGQRIASPEMSKVA
jgi:hypothetical protein